MFFGKKKAKYDAMFANCDFEFAKVNLITTFEGGIISNDLAPLLHAYVRNPCRKTAIPLIEYDEDEFAKYFLENKILKGMMEFVGRDTTSPRKTSQALEMEPEYEEFCQSYLPFLQGESDRHKELESIFLSKGYTADMLSKALSGYLDFDGAVSDLHEYNEDSDIGEEK